MVLKLEHSGYHATFLDLNITIRNVKISNKFYNKRDDFFFFIVRMPSFHSNIPPTVFYSVFLRSFVLQDIVFSSRYISVSSKLAKNH